LFSGKIIMTDKLIIFDTTLRDGEQSPGASMTREEKLRIARQLERMKVDVMEAGFAAASNGDFEAIKAIASVIKDSTVCSLARANDRDIARAAEALKAANSWRIHTFIATSPLHMEKKLRMSPEQVLEQAKQAVRFARNLTADVEFSAEDGYRSEIDFLARVCEAVIAEGATTINIPDTVGYAIPELYGNFIKTLREKVPNSDKAIWSVHCHNDLGMAVANSLAGVKIGGARQIECTVNGLGERAGNCAMEEVVMAIKTRRDYFGLDVGVDTTQIMPASRLVSQTTGFVVQPNKAVVGANAFAHASGIHQDGVLKNRENYEIMTPESIGLNQIQLNLTSRSGRAAVKHRMDEMGYKESEYNLDNLYDAFLKLADKKGQVFDYDLEALAFIGKQQEEPEHFRLDYFSVQSGSNDIATAAVKLACGEEVKAEAANGNGPVDAVYQAINRITDYNVELVKYSLTAKGHGKDALGQVDIVANYNGRRFHGVGLATDIVESSAKAMVHVLNNIWRAAEVEKELQRKAQHNENNKETV